MISYMPLMRTLEEREMRLCDLEDKMNLSRSSLRQVINKGGYLRLSTLIKIAEILNCGVDNLISWKEGEGAEKSSKFQPVNWERLVDLCKEQKLAFTALSVKLEHSANYMTQSRRFASALSPIDLEKIAAILNVDVKEIMR